MTLGAVTLAIPFYRNVSMLQRQVQEWERYPTGVQIIIIDDGSPEPAKPIIEAHASTELLKRIALYRIMVDVQWNREEARNLSTVKCETQWLVHVDIDHLLPVESAAALLASTPNAKHWYRFPRWRKGRADETRRKDAIPDHVEFGAIHPHVDSYLVTKDMYWRAGGYDLSFSGCLGGGSDFLKRLERISEPRLLPPDVALHVYTRSEVKDASDWSLSRDTTEGKRRARVKQAAGSTDLQGVVRSPWERQL